MSDDMLKRIVEWAKNEESVRVAILVGSHAENRPTDEFSDHDVNLFVTDQDRYANDENWLSDFGEVWLCEKNTGEGEAGVAPVHYRLTIFDPGARVDFSIYSAKMLEVIVRSQAPAGPNIYTLGYRVLVDKDGGTQGMAPPFSRRLEHEPPTETAFRSVIEDFWHEAHNTAKYIARDDLWSVKFRDWQTKVFLLSMLEWHAQAIHGWDYDTTTIGKRMASWIDPSIWNDLQRAFGHFNADDSWDALFATIGIFQRVAAETADLLDYPYPEFTEMVNLIHSIRQASA